MMLIILCLISQASQPASAREHPDGWGYWITWDTGDITWHPVASRAEEPAPSYQGTWQEPAPAELTGGGINLASDMQAWRFEFDQEFREYMLVDIQWGPPVIHGRWPAGLFRFRYDDKMVGWLAIVAVEGSTTSSLSSALSLYELDARVGPDKFSVEFQFTVDSNDFLVGMTLVEWLRTQDTAEDSWYFVGPINSSWWHASSSFDSGAWVQLIDDLVQPGVWISAGGIEDVISPSLALMEWSPYDMLQYVPTEYEVEQIAEGNQSVIDVVSSRNDNIDVVSRADALVYARQTLRISGRTHVGPGRTVRADAYVYGYRTDVPPVLEFNTQSYDTGWQWTISMPVPVDHYGSDLTLPPGLINGLKSGMANDGWRSSQGVAGAVEVRSMPGWVVGLDRYGPGVSSGQAFDLAAAEDAVVAESATVKGQFASAMRDAGYVQVADALERGTVWEGVSWGTRTALRWRLDEQAGDHLLDRPSPVRIASDDWIRSPMATIMSTTLSNLNGTQYSKLLMFMRPVIWVAMAIMGVRYTFSLYSWAFGVPLPKKPLSPEEQAKADIIASLNRGRRR